MRATRKTHQIKIRAIIMSRMTRQARIAQPDQVGAQIGEEKLRRYNSVDGMSAVRFASRLSVAGYLANSEVQHSR